MIHTNAPWVPTGYGIQGRQLARCLRADGHDVAFSAFSGLSGADITWNDFPVFPAGQMAFGIDVIIPHAERFQADLIITLMDFYKLLHIAPALTEYNVAAWLPIDSSPMSRQDLQALQMSKAKPIAMSHHGERMLIAEGFKDVLYAPHSTDTDTFRPYHSDERDKLRADYGFGPNDFIIGICAANKDAIRKAFPEQFHAVSMFRNGKSQTARVRLLVHSTPQNVGGYDLMQMAEDMGIADIIHFTEQYRQDSGQIDQSAMADWYNLIDVLSMCSYGEGFGVPMIEAQACGVPVVSTVNSALSELNGAGWASEGDPFWNSVHRAWWYRPNARKIAHDYERAFEAWLDTNRWQRHGKMVRRFAQDYSFPTVYKEFWRPILEAVDE